jgi:hypothetical protein
MNDNHYEPGQFDPPRRADRWRLSFIGWYLIVFGLAVVILAVFL